MNNDRFFPWPYVFDNGEWSIPDDILKMIWLRMVKEGKATATFYNGHITTAEEWISFLKSPGNFPVFIGDKVNNDVVMVAWLNGLKDGVAQCHFCTIGRYVRGAEKAVIDYWESWNRNGEMILRVILGITPAPYEAALKLVRMAGLQRVGEVPGMCYMAYKKEFVPGVISHYQFKGVQNG